MPDLPLRPELRTYREPGWVMLKHDNGNTLFRHPVANDKKSLLTFMDNLDLFLAKYDTGKIDIAQSV